MTRRDLMLALVAVLLGIAAADAARRAPGFALAGESLARVVLGVAAGWAVVAAGLALTRGGARRPGQLLAAAGCVWMAAGLATPGARAGALFTLGLMLGAAAPALMAHALLLIAGERLRGLPDRLLVVTLYASLVGLVGILPTLVVDPRFAGCTTCPANFLALLDEPLVAAEVSRLGIQIGTFGILSAGALALRRLALATVTRRRTRPLVVPVTVYLALVAAQLTHSWERGYLGADAVDQALWTGQAVALLGVAAGVALVQAVARRRRSQLAQVVVDLNARRAGGLQQALAQLLGDRDLELLYARPAGGWIDESGRAREPAAGKGVTQLARGREPVALLCHRPGLLDDPRTVSEIEQTVRLGLEHERLHAELRHQLGHLRESRAAVVAAGEAERRLLERDLHDGAQQHLVALSFSLGIASRRACSRDADVLARAQLQVQEALTELRELAHGIYPVALADAGLAAAIESLSDRRPELRARDLPAERFPPAIEEAAYHAIARLVDECSPRPLAVAGTIEGDRLRIDLSTEGSCVTELADVEDRVGALGGSVTVACGPGAIRVVVELPCE